MSKLDEIRKEIDKVDERMLILFEKRMKFIEEISKYKKKNNQEIFDEKREEELLEKNIAKLKNKKLAKHYQDMLKKTIEISKKYQENIRWKNKKGE